ncbi:DNA-directed DNA polymerase [Tanacetum coccineum]
MEEVILLYKGLEVPTRQILVSKGAIPTMTAANAKTTIQELAEHSQKWHDGMSTRTRSTETSDRLAAIQAQLNNLRREIKKVNEKVYATQVGCELCKGSHYTKDCPLKEEGKTLIEAYYTQLGVPFPQRGQYKETALGFYQRNNGNPSNQGASIKALEIQIGQLSKVLQEKGYGNLPSSTKINPRDHVKAILTIVEVDRTLIRQEGSYRLKDLDAYSIGTTLLDNALPNKEKGPWSFTLPCIIDNMYFNKALADLRASVSVMPFSTYTKLGLGELAPTKLIVELADRTVNRPKGIAENVLVRIDKFVFLVDFIILDMPEDIKTPLILKRPLLSIAHAKIDVFKRKITLKVGNDKVLFKRDKPTINIIKRVYMISLREMIEIDLEARLIGEALILNRSLDPLYNTSCFRSLYDIM